MRPFWTLILPLALGASLCSAAGLAGPAEDQYELAARQYELKRYQAAAVEFEEFLKNYPRHEKAPLVRLFLGEAFVQLGKFADARAAFDAFHAQHPAHSLAPRALFRRGEAAYLTGDFAAARRNLGDFHRQYPADPLNAYALPYLGDLALQADEAAEAQQHYSAALRQYAETTLGDECRFGLAKALQMQGRLDDAERFFRYLVDKPDSPLADDALLQLGQLQHQRGEHDAALETFGDLAAKFPQSELIPYAQYWTGLAHAGKEDWAAAVAALEKSAALEAGHPLRPAVHFHCGDALRRAGRAEEANEHFRRVLEEDPASTWADRAAHGQLRIASDGENHEVVQQQAAKFLDQFPDSPLGYDVRRMLGRAQLKQGQYEASAGTLTALVRELNKLHNAADDGRPAMLSRAEVESLLTSSRYLLGLAHVGNEQYEQALAAIAPIQVSEADEPRLAASLSALRASALWGLNRSADAVGPLRTYLRLEPEGADANKSRAQLAMALAQTGKLDEAQRVYDELTRTYSDREQFLQTTHVLAERAFSAGEKVWARELFATLADEQNPAEFRELGLSGKAWTELDLKAPIRSAESFDRLLSEFPDSPLAPEAALARGEALEQLQRHDAALGMYTLVIDKYPQSKQTPEAIYRAAKLCDDLQQNAEAAELFARYAKDYPQQSNMDAALYRWAWVLADLQRVQESSAVFTRLHMEYPRSRYWADATFRLAEQAAAAGEYGRVAELADAIAGSGSTEPIVAHALHLKGHSAARAGRWEDVAGPMEQLLAKFANSPLKLSAEYWIAESHYRQGNFDESDRRFALLARNTQGRSDTWLAMVPLRRAQVLAHERKWSAAYAMAQNIASDIPGFSQQYEVDFLLGRCLAQQAKFQQAREAYQRVTESAHGRRTETAAMAQWNVGESYFHQKDYENAIRAYSHVELLYDFPQWQAAALLQAGKCFELQGEHAEAIQRYTRVIDDFADTPFKDEAAQRLAVVQQRADVSAQSQATHHQ